MFNQALLWKIHFAFFGMATLARIRDKGAEPTVDEVYILDTIFQNEKVSQYFKPESYHIIDYDQEWDQGIDGETFPEYDTGVSRFFNADTNTTTGKYQFGDVETGATMTFSNNKYNFTEPFLIYDLVAEINHDGEFTREHIIRAEDTFKTKRIFVIWH